MPDVSLFASAVRPKIWKSFFDSLEGTSIDYEVVFAGHIKEDELEKNIHHRMFNRFKYVKTEFIKPSQCYALASRECSGKTIIWVADDAEFNNNVVGKSYDYWKSKQNEKLILSIQTKESGYKNLDGQLFNMNIHRFFGGNPYTPLMCPLGLMSRNFFNELGGIDQRYVSGQYENDLVMRAYTQGAKVEIFGDSSCYINIDHLSKSILCGECTNDDNFRERPFAKGYTKDREVLEKSWVIYNDKGQPISISPKQLDEFQPYPENIPLDHSLSNKGIWQ